MTLFHKTFDLENFNYSCPDEVFDTVANLLEDIKCLQEDVKEAYDKGKRAGDIDAIVERNRIASLYEQVGY